MVILSSGVLGCNLGERNRLKRKRLLADSNEVNLIDRYKVLSLETPTLYERAYYPVFVFLPLIPFYFTGSICFRENFMALLREVGVWGGWDFGYKPAPLR